MADSISISSRKAALVLTLLGAAAFGGAWNFTFLAPVLPSVAHDTGVSVAAAGQLVAVSAVATLVFLAAFGPLSDRYGRRPTLMAGLAAMATAAFGSALTSTYGLLVALRILSGLADALVLPSAASAISDYFRAKDREVALNLLLIPMGAAAIIGLPVVVLIDAVLDWHAAFFVFAAFNVAALFGIFWFLPRVRATARSTRSLIEHYRESYGEVLGTRSAIAVLSAAVLGAAVWNGMVTYAGAFFRDELGAEGAGLSAIFAAIGGSYVLGGVAGAVLARRLPPRQIAVWSTLAAVLLLLPLVTSTGVSAVTVMLAIAFAGSRAPGIAAFNNILLELSPSAQGTAVSTYGVVAATGVLLGAAGGGLAVAIGGYVAMATLFTVLAAGAVLLVARPPEGVRPPIPATPF